jgi:hypothetical protein
MKISEYRDGSLSLVYDEGHFIIRTIGNDKGSDLVQAQTNQDIQEVRPDALNVKPSHSLPPWFPPRAAICIIIHTPTLMPPSGEALIRFHIGF